mgnify:CR=1 FL=1
MKIVVSLLLFGIFSLPFLHDHRVLQAEAGYGSRASDHSSLVRHVHLDENSSHFPKSESDKHESQGQWSFLEDVTLTTLTSGSSTNLFIILPNVDTSPSDIPSADLHQSFWEPTSPVRGSPLIDSDTFLPFSNLPSFHSGRAPPLSSL